MKNTGLRSKITVSADGKGLVSQAGGLLLAEALQVTGLGQGLSGALTRWRAPRAVHDPGKIIADLAMALGLGGDCLADVAVLRAQPELAGPVASDPVISRLISALAADAPRALRAIRKARAAARERAWALAGARAWRGREPDPGGPRCHDRARAFGEGESRFHLEENVRVPSARRVRRSRRRSRRGAAGHRAAPRERRVEHRSRAHRGDPAGAGPTAARARRRVLIRTDSGGGTHEFLAWLASPGRRLHYSIGMTITDEMQQAILQLPDRIWEPAYDAGGQARPGAWVAELTGLLGLAGWPEGMRVIVRKERPHPGAQLRFTDIGGHRFTAFATDAWRGQLADLELRHRRRARCEDRIRNAKDTGLRNLPLHVFNQNQIWCELVAMACELLAWMQMLALDGPARAWEPKRLRLRMFSAAGRLVCSGRRLRLRLAATWPWASQLTTAITRLQAFAPG